MPKAIRAHWNASTATAGEQKSRHEVGAASIKVMNVEKPILCNKSQLNLRACRVAIAYRGVGAVVGGAGRMVAQGSLDF